MGTGTRAGRGGGVSMSASSTMPADNAFTMTGGSITNNTATSEGGGIWSARASNALAVPASAFRDLNIGEDAIFYGNTAGNGASAPPDNRLPRISATASTSIWDYVLNNYDINYTGRLGQTPSPQSFYYNNNSYREAQEEEPSSPESFRVDVTIFVDGVAVAERSLLLDTYYIGEVLGISPYVPGVFDTENYTYTFIRWGHIAGDGSFEGGTTEENTYFRLGSPSTNVLHAYFARTAANQLDHYYYFS